MNAHTPRSIDRARPANTRRQFFQTAGSLAALTAGELAFVNNLPRVSAQEASPSSKDVQFRPEIEPLVRLLEDTPRDQLLEKVADRIREGVSYREILAALFLAGVRNVQPRPSVGFKFHAVLVVNSAHLASMSSPENHRWLPIFWALDYFKSSQARDVREGNWTMAAVDESRVPGPQAARLKFVEAMEQWDVPAADAAIAGYSRAAGGAAVFEDFFRFAARDFRSIGHKAIFAANSWRTLQCIGWDHREPVLRSLAYALLNHEGGNPAKRDGEPDRPGRENLKRLAEIRQGWQIGRLDEGATREMIATLRNADDRQASQLVVEQLNAGIDPQSIWDGIFMAASELLVRQPGIVSLHALTTTNALRFAYETCADDNTRKLVMLQNAAFLTLFRGEMNRRGNVSTFALEQFQQAGDARPSLESILASISGNRMQAAQDVFAYLESGGDPKTLIDASRVLIFRKGNDSHDYKFSSAVLEDYYKVSPKFRSAFLAASVFRLKGEADRDTPLVQRVQAAFA